jgi:catechol 2,3-dioxygenase-like lactoylglutathione lyase family enzyme
MFEEASAMTQPNGMHHIAIMAADMKKHIAFFSEVMGCPLVALFDMHGVPGGLHAFMRLSDDSFFSIVQMPKVADAPIQIGVTHAGTGAGASAAGTMQHFAFRAADENALIAMRDRIRSHGVNAIGPIDHGMCKSIYFAGPDQITLEVACPGVAIDPRAWIDPSTCEKAGIDAAELARFKAPAPYVGPSPVPQPPYDPSKPHMAYDPAQYRAMIGAPDEVIAKASYAEPPVKITA